MSDEFLDDLRRNWREQDAEVELVAGRLRRGLLEIGRASCRERVLQVV